MKRESDGGRRPGEDSGDVGYHGGRQWWCYVSEWMYEVEELENKCV